MKLFLITSLLVNVLLAGYSWKTNKELEFSRIVNKYNLEQSKIDIDPTSDKNFRRIFIEKNDSLYKEFYSITYENSTAPAYLLACGYYQTTGSKLAKEHIEQTYKELKEYLK